MKGDFSKWGFSPSDNYTGVLHQQGLFGVVGYLMKKFAYEGAPLILAFVLSPLLENALRQSLIMSNGDFYIFFSRPISLLLILAALFLLPFQGSRYLLSQALAIPDLFTPFTPGRFFGMFVNATLTYLDIVLVGHAIHYARASRQEGLHRAQLEARLEDAQLQVLRLQLHQHFLLNTLHTVSALMHKDLRAADRMLGPIDPGDREGAAPRGPARAERRPGRPG